ncbi:MAG: hypothetical protein ACREXW_16865 [Gammaproteobacteria bacterium]
MLGLLRHFGIPCNDPDRWFKLALALAHKHYPKGAPNPIGRPRKGSIAKLYALGHKRGGRRGRPRGDQIACLHNSVWFYQQEHPRATDKAAIIAVLKESVRLNNEELGQRFSERDVVKDRLPRLQQALARYRARLRRPPP